MGNATCHLSCSKKKAIACDRFHRFTCPVQILESAREVLKTELDALHQLENRLEGELGNSVEDAVSYLKGAVEGGHKIIVTGVGKSGQIGQKIAATLTSTGAPAITLDPLNATHGDAGLILEGDVIVALSYSGETEELLRILPILRRTDNAIIAITSKKDSTLSSHARVFIDASVEKEACPLNLAPTASTTVALVWGDILAMALLQERGVTKETFSLFHPSGSIGRRLLTAVSEIMRPLEEVAVCPLDVSVSEALQEITQKRCGACIVQNADGTLAGIYTHGDFVRGYQKDHNIGESLLSEVLIAQPVCVAVDKLAAEVLNIFENHRIEDLIVVDPENRPVGMVDSSDLSRLKIF